MLDIKRHKYTNAHSNAAYLRQFGGKILRYIWIREKVKEEWESANKILDEKNYYFYTCFFYYLDNFFSSNKSGI